MPYGDRGRPREIFPATPFLFLQTRDDILTWSTNSYFIWTVEATNTSDFHYKTTKSKIFILTSGYYEITYELSPYLYSGTMDYGTFYICKNGTMLDGSKCMVRLDTLQRPVCVSTHYYCYLNAGDYLQLRADVGAGGGTLRTVSHTVRFIIKFMPAHGWNNSRGGAINYRGGVSR